MNTDTLYRKGQRMLYFLRTLGSLNICQKRLLMFYQSVMGSVLSYSTVWCVGEAVLERETLDDWTNW